MSSNTESLTHQRTRRGKLLDAAIARFLKMPLGHRNYTVTPALPVRMRDGVELLTDVYEPVGQSLGTLLMRSPYARTGANALLTARYFATHGYHVVYQSCRGTFGSGGVFEPFRPDVDDGADTVAWLRTQPWFGGRFALWGPSYVGYTAWAVMTDPPQELAAAVIAISPHDNYWLTHGTGAFALDLTLGLLEVLEHNEGGPVTGFVRGLTADRRLKPGFQELPLVRAQDTVLAGSRMPYREWLTTPDAEDPLWRTMRLGQALDRVDVPVLLQEGWQDPFLDQMLDQYEHLRRRGVDVGLTIGPWTHFQVATKGANVVMERRWIGWRSTSPGPVAGGDQARSTSSSQVPRNGVTCRHGRRRPTSECSTFSPMVPWMRRNPRPAQALRCSPTIPRIPLRHSPAG